MSGVIDDRLAHAVANLKEQGRLRRDLDLRRESGRFEFFVALEQFGIQRSAIGQRLAKHRGRDAMEPRVERIDQNQSVIREDTREQLSKGAAVGFAWRVGLRQQFGDGRTARSAQELSGGLGDFLDCWTEFYAADGMTGLLFSREFKSRSLARVEPGDVPYFVEIVIFGCHPKDRDGIDAGLREFVRDLNRAQRFVKGVRGAAEESDLLPAEYSDGAVGEALDIFRGRFAVAERGIRVPQNCGDFLAAVVRIFQRLRGLLNGFERRR